MSFDRSTIVTNRVKGQGVPAADHNAVGVAVLDLDTRVTTLEANPKDVLVNPLYPGASLTAVATSARTQLKAIGGTGTVHIVNTTKATTTDLTANGSAVSFAISVGDSITITTPSLTAGPTAVVGG